MSNLKAAVGEKEAAAIRKRLTIWAKSRNPNCADCSRTNPTWASVNLGVLVCLECAGRHRSLGTHISKMRSITLDTILPEEALFLMNMSNALANKYWEAQLSEAERLRAVQGSHFISQKYQDRRWALADSSVPVPSAQCVPHTHPWWRDAQAAAPSAAVTPAATPQSTPAIQLPVRKSASTAPAAAAAPVADLIDFGDFESAPQPAAGSASGDPFGCTSTTSGAESTVASRGVDPFASAEPACAKPDRISQAALPQQQAHDPFAIGSGIVAAHSTPQESIGAQVPRHSSAPGQVLQGSTPMLPPMAQPAAISQAPTAAARGMPGQQHSESFTAPCPPATHAIPVATGMAGCPAGVRSPQTGAGESKEDMHARIMALYNTRPSSAPSSTGMFGAQPAAPPQPLVQNMPPPQFAAPAAYRPPRP